MSSVFEAVFGKQNPAVEFEMQSCASCGIAFSAPVHFFQSRRKDGKGFFCPNGHSLTFGKTEADKLKEQLAQKERDLEWARGQRDSYKRKGETLERRLAATKGVLTKTKKRVARGKCPKCSKEFADLAKHMGGQHPEYGHEAEGHTTEGES